MIRFNGEMQRICLKGIIRQKHFAVYIQCFPGTFGFLLGDKLLKGRCPIVM